MQLHVLGEVILNNLNTIHDEHYPKDVLECIADTSVSYLEPAFQEAEKFYKNNDRFPDFNYLKGIVGDVLEENNTDFSLDMLPEFLRKVRQEAKRNRAIQLLSEGKDSEANILLESGHEEGEEPETMEDIEDIYEEIVAKGPGLYFGVKVIDEWFRSCTFGTMTVISAPPKCGKTTLAVSSFYHNIMYEGKNCVYFTMEISTKEMLINLIARHSQVMGKPLSARRIKNGELTDMERQILREVKADFNAKVKGKYKIIEPKHLAGITPWEMTRFIKRLVTKWGVVHGLYVDYLQLMRHYRLPGIRDQYEVMNYWVRYSHNLAVTMNIAVFLLSQVNRQGERELEKKNQARNDALAEANELERSAYRAILLHSTKGMRDDNETKIYFLLHRAGPIPEDPIDCYIDFAHFRVGDDDYSQIKTLDNVKKILHEVEEEDEFGDEGIGLFV
jgi:hypothetical protein